MNPHEIAKDAIRIATTAGLSKDVIDLLKEKVALLTDKIAALEQEKSVLQTENADLKKKVENLEQEIDRLRPKTNELDGTQIAFLKLLFDHGNLSTEAVSRQLGISKGMADYHRGILMHLDMIVWISVGMKSEWMGIDQPGTFAITQKGRKYLVENKLV